MDQKTVLWVDDDVTLKKRLAPALEDEGLTVLTADDAEQGVSLFKEHGESISLAVLDIMMPAASTTAA